MKKRYIGDAVYIEFDGLHIVLTTSDGIRDTNRICLDNTVMISFEQWVKEFKQEMIGEGECQPG